MINKRIFFWRDITKTNKCGYQVNFKAKQIKKKRLRIKSKNRSNKFCDHSATQWHDSDHKNACFIQQRTFGCLGISGVCDWLVREFLKSRVLCRYALAVYCTVEEHTKRIYFFFKKKQQQGDERKDEPKKTTIYQFVFRTVHARTAHPFSTMHL